MPTFTTNYALRKPTAAEPADGPTGIGNLADDTDAALLAQLTLKPKGVVGRGSRVTASSASTGAEIGVLRVDNIPIVAGRLYRIWTSPLIFNSTIANDLITAGIRVSTSGVANTASTQLTALAETALSSGASQRTKGLEIDYPAGVTGNLSVILTVNRTTGTGGCNINASGTFPIDLVIEDCGVDPGDTGVDL